MPMPSDSKKRRRRRRKKGGGAGVVLAFLGVVLIIAAIVAAMIIFFKIRAVGVTGESRYSQSDIAASSGIEPGQNMFLFNKFAAISRIFAEYPYLDEISIRRRLPDEVEIIITECVPAAVVHSMSVYEKKALKSGEPPEITHKDEHFIIDAKGKLLEKIEGDLPAGLTVVEGVNLKNPEVGKYAVFDDDQKQKPLFLVLNSAIDSDILQNIGVIDLNETYNISFTYGQQLWVKIGTTEELDKKIRYMHLIIDEHLSETDRGTIDVSNTQTARFIREK